MPAQMRLYDDSEPTYSIYAVVRSVLGFPRDRCVRVKFFGKNPPRGHALDPGTRYLLRGDVPSAQRERRQGPRYEIFMNLFIGRLPANGGQTERTVTENLSAEGARVPTTLALSPGETVTVSELDGDFRTAAVARGLYVGQDHIRRVNLNFQNPVPRRLIAVAQG
jgi:hypothetical protein